MWRVNRGTDMYKFRFLSILAVVMVGFLGFNPASHGAEKGVSVFVSTADTYKRLSAADRRGYIMGVMDVLTLYALGPNRDIAPSLEAKASALEIKRCVGLMTTKRIDRIYGAWLTKNPEFADRLAAESLIQATWDDCNKVEKTKQAR